ncbi:hypothetical protein SEA_INDRA_98 [Mycobacterium phage Indra]|uniref:hypothetical protein n=1 Tax=Mycobacterium phage Artemis2UCLA TaxID=1391429 RepID=UPI0003C9AD62|nr:hypothetical protein X828_gp019 [Mycobacterium phage Artemis2UCLA]AHB29988.1 hypothetical protein ARTEMIS2UCLA_95 [Mycobacterium phage Artemis2UCLA]QWT29772.1 hypothetical protein SEA_INDRA_98 [Mycobacterium phage Indra]QYC54093.1 hypothetical protein SEA_ROKSOLANA_96 [Mycobacterium phage Roksolana]
MYELIVRKNDGSLTGEATGSGRLVLTDHLEASAARFGFEVEWNEPGESGHIKRNGKFVGTWEITVKR